jgi:Asp-tRNA(Asn)/Glu-tRNA(Gln) amidotransferase A subunit family amidase
VRAAALRADQRRARGDRLGPLHGVPLVFKDNIDTADFPTTAGTPALAANRPKRNATIVQRLLDVGAIVLGKANLQELAWGPTNNNAAFGPARNPYDPTRIPGGSSGGTGAAVAARLAPAGLGTDTGGSIRVPASLSGVVSLRPTTLRWPQAGIVPISHTRDTAGPMARCVVDCALIDGVITGGPTEVAAVRLDGLRIGVPRGHFWEGLDDELTRIVEPVLEELRDTGAVLIEGDVADVASLDRAAGFPIALYEFVTDLNDYLTEHETGLDFARVVAQAKSPIVKDALTGLTGAGAISETVYREALGTHRPKLQETYRRYFQERGVAVMIFPTTPLPAAKIGKDDTVVLNGTPVPTLATYIRNLGPGSTAGIPGMSLPAGMTKAGLPVGIAIEGPAGSDQQVLAIGLALEALLPKLPTPRPLSRRLLPRRCGPCSMREVVPAVEIGNEPRLLGLPRSRVRSLEVGLSSIAKCANQPKWWFASSGERLSTGRFRRRPMTPAMSRNGTPSSATL